MTKNKPLVSIVAICYNHSRFLEKTLDSIRNQTYQNLEVLIIDSFSSDGSFKLIENYVKENDLGTWMLHRQERKTSICENLNLALSLINGEYYQVISCDDIIHPNKIAIQVNELIDRNYESIGLIYSDYSHIDEEGNPIVEEQFILKKHGFSKLNLPPSGYVFCEILGTWFIHTITCLISKKAAESIGGYDENLSYEDTDFILRLSKEFKFIAVLNELAYYRIVSDSLFKTRSIDFYVSTCKLYLKHRGVPVCNSKVKRLISHYYDTLFQMDPYEALKIYLESSSSDFEFYILWYTNFFRLTGKKEFALKFKSVLKKLI
ncbi:glycosyltransferase [Algoriphagus kandeliae]|uniref:glycosyltransferase n=1 Tax=Algoriphagus kandeliae TaxID=2562278 RepID=UPI0013867A8D|nr:glycosyltransferase [Algoriphagus kandeliae]